MTLLSKHKLYENDIFTSTESTDINKIDLVSLKLENQNIHHDKIVNNLMYICARRMNLYSLERGNQGLSNKPKIT